MAKKILDDLNIQTPNAARTEKAYNAKLSFQQSFINQTFNSVKPVHK